MSKTYTIKPLEWEERGPDAEGRIELVCYSTFGLYWSGWEPSKKSYTWGLSDELLAKKCDSLAAGKAAAEAHYLARILPALSPTHPKEK